MKEFILFFLIVLSKQVFCQTSYTFGYAGGSIVESTSYGYSNVKSDKGWCTPMYSGTMLTINVGANSGSSVRTARITGNKTTTTGTVSFEISITQEAMSTSSSKPIPCNTFAINGMNGLWIDRTTYSFTTASLPSQYGYSYNWTISENSSTAYISSGQGTPVINVYADPYRVHGILTVYVTASSSTSGTCSAVFYVSPL